MRLQSHVPRRIAAAIGAGALSIGGLALIGVAPPAGASGGPNPPTTPVAYEVDAYNATAGEGVPLIVTTAGLTLTGGTAPLYPQGATYGLAGSVSYTAIGALLAGLAANSIPLSFTVGGLALAGDSTATGQYDIPVYSGSFTANTTPVTDASWSDTSPIVSSPSGQFTQAEVGDGIVPAVAPKTAFQGVEIVAVNVAGTEATLSGDPSTTNAGPATIELYGPSTLTQTFATATNQFTTNAASEWPGDHSTTADVNLVSAGVDTIGYTIGGALVAGPGPQGNSSPGENEAVITGYTAADVAGPGVETLADPSPGTLSCSYPPTLPPGSVNPIQSTGCPGTPTAVTADAASVPLSESAPVAANQTVNLGVGETGNAQLGCTPEAPSTVASYTQVTTSPQADNGNSLSFSTNPSTGVLSLNDTGQAGAAVITIDFTCTDSLGLTSNTGIVTVNLGTPPVIQPFSESVSAGSLVTSCTPPVDYITPRGENQSPAPTSSTPSLTCTQLLVFPSITLDGLEQTVSGGTGDIYISDNRGSPLDSWTLTANLIPSGSNNPNPFCAGVVGFCNSSIGSAALNTASNGVHDGQIPPDYLQVAAGDCIADPTGGTGTPPYNPPNLNPDALPSGGNLGGPVTLCSALTGQSGGTFIYAGGMTLTLPESLYAGTYYGSFSFTIA